MKIGENDTNIFEEDNEAVLGDIAAKYFVLKKQFADGTMEIKDGERIINGPPHDTNYMRAFEQKYNVTFDSLETWLEVKDFFENDWSNHINNIIIDEFANKGAKKIKTPE
jgi:hypothetical protein